MGENSELQCEYKHILIEIVPIGKEQWASIYVLADKKSVKQYCRDTDLPFREGLKTLYNDNKKRTP